MDYYLLHNGTAVVGGGVTPDGTYPDGSIPCTQAQYQNPSVWQVVSGALVACTPPPPDTRAAAQTALDKSDVTVGRCYEHGVAVPADWVAYRAALRAHVSDGPTTAALPTRPAYPAGT
jgi:hypothetical protein